MVAMTHRATRLTQERLKGTKLSRLHNRTAFTTLVAVTTALSALAPLSAARAQDEDHGRDRREVRREDKDVQKIQKDRANLDKDRQNLRRNDRDHDTVAASNNRQDAWKRDSSDRRDNSNDGWRRDNDRRDNNRTVTEPQRRIVGRAPARRSLPNRHRPTVSATGAPTTS